MAIAHLSQLLRWSFIASLLLLIGTVAFSLISSPTVVSTAGAQGLVYLVLFILALLIYSWFALSRTKARTQAEQVSLRTGTLWGLLCSMVWVIELLVANVVSLGWGWLHLVLYFGSTLTGYVLPGLAGLLAASRSRHMVSGLQAGLLTGMMGALAIFLTSLFLSAFLLQAGQHDPQTMREFAHSGLPDLTTYLVGDYLAGMIVHLWIGLITGLFLGILGGMVGKALAPLIPGDSR